jgi:hypothetical protein
MKSLISSTAPPADDLAREHLRARRSSIRVGEAQPRETGQEGRWKRPPQVLERFGYDEVVIEEPLPAPRRKEGHRVGLGRGPEGTEDPRELSVEALQPPPDVPRAKRRRSEHMAGSQLMTLSLGLIS